MMQNPIKRHNIKLRHLFINGKSFRQRIQAKTWSRTFMLVSVTLRRGPPGSAGVRRGQTHSFVVLFAEHTLTVPNYTFCLSSH